MQDNAGRHQVEARRGFTAGELDRQGPGVMKCLAAITG